MPQVVRDVSVGVGATQQLRNTLYHRDVHRAMVYVERLVRDHGEKAALENDKQDQRGEDVTVEQQQQLRTRRVDSLQPHHFRQEAINQVYVEQYRDVVKRVHYGVVHFLSQR